jgi:pimeloyl-ACP methyl ester carboxylesterase
VFTSDQREAVRKRLLELAETDPRITGAAVTGSAADGREDRWSDIDLFFGVADHVALAAVVADWSGHLYRELGALHHFELTASAAVYRAFLLPSCLEVDLGFTPAERFGPVGRHFRAVFGEAAQPPLVTPPDPGHLIGLAWHRVLHARSCIERHKPWQAEYWISGIRDQTLALACLRLGKPTDYAKGADALPSAVTGELEAALVRSLEPDELRRALRVAAARLIPELYATDPDQARRLEGPIRELADVPDEPALNMATFDGADGTRLAYHQAGEGRPLICLPGGPMQASAYLGDLGGLSAHRRLVLLDLRGTGESAVPADPAGYRCDRQVGDVEALRVHLGLDRIDLLGHSAGAALALLYAARHPDRVGRLALLNPSPRAVGLEITDLDRRQVTELRRGEVWFPDAFAALERIWSGEATAADWRAIAPFTYGRWDAAAQAHLAREASQTNAEAAAVYYSAGALDPVAVRSALARLRAPVLLVAGEYAVALPPKCAAEYAGLFGQAELAVQPGGGHFGWLDDPTWLVQTLAGFLR